MDYEKVVLMVLIVILGTAVIGLCLEDCEKDETSIEDVRDKSELEKSLDEDEMLVDISSVCIASYGVDEEYGAYYEIRMYDGSSVTYYKVDGAYEIRENSDKAVIVETMDYWLILYDKGQEVKYKKRTYDEGANVIGVIEK